MTALIAMMGISAAGPGALLHTFPMVFDALRLAGATYLRRASVMRVFNRLTGCVFVGFAASMATVRE